MSADRPSRPAPRPSAGAVRRHRRLGFIGSNVVHRLAAAGAAVVVIDALVPEHGGEQRERARLDVEVLVADIGAPDVADAVAGADVVFNVAGQVSHLASMREPLRDLDLNVRSHLASSRRCARRARRPWSCRPRPARSTAARSTCPSTRSTRRDRSTSTASTSWPASSSTAVRRAHDMRHVPAADERLRAPPAPRAGGPRLPAGVHPPGAARRGHRAVRRRARSGATACTSTTSSRPCCSSPTTPEAAGEIFNLGHPDSLTLAEIARLTGDAAGHGRRGRVRPVARRAAAHRHRQLPGRLRQGQAGARLVAAHLRSPTASRRRSATTRSIVVPLVDLRRRHVASKRPSSTPSAACSVGDGAARPRAGRVRARGRRLRSDGDGRRRRGQRGGRARSWCWPRWASVPATRSSCRRSPPCRRRRRSAPSAPRPFRRRRRRHRAIDSTARSTP